MPQRVRSVNSADANLAPQAGLDVDEVLKPKGADDIDVQDRPPTAMHLPREGNRANESALGISPALGSSASSRPIFD